MELIPSGGRNHTLGQRMKCLIKETIPKIATLCITVTIYSCTTFMQQKCQTLVDSDGFTAILGIVT
jgi:hypothetical protein